jgi:hypothetical protein
VTGNAFTISCNDWKEGTYENFKDWALKQFDINPPDSDDEGEVPVQMMKAKDIKFEQKETGELILPPLSNYKTVRQKQRVVRGYIGAVYRQLIHYIFLISFLTILIGDFTGSPRSAFPYTLASKDGQEIYSPDSVPQEFCLSDPDHYSAFKIDSLYKHWLERQKKGLQPFVIVNPSPRHEKKVKRSHKGKAKAKADWVDVNSEGEQDEIEQEQEEEKEEEEQQEPDDDDFSDVNEEQSSATKYAPPLGPKIGPPIGRKKQFPVSPVAGPSTLPPVKHFKPSKISAEKTYSKPPNAPKLLNLQQRLKKRIIGKKKKGTKDTDTKGLFFKLTTSRTVKDPNVKKRKAEEDLAIGVPQKLSKTDPHKKSGRLGGREIVGEPVEETALNTGKGMKIETGMKRKHLEEEELTEQSSGKANLKRIKSNSLKYVQFFHTFSL